GVELPTGEDNKKDKLGSLPKPLQLGSGSFDFINGVVWTTQALSWELDIDVGYKLNTEADGFKFGDVLFSNISYQKRLKPSVLPESGVPSFLYGVLELNSFYKRRNEVLGAKDPNSGGSIVYAAFGIQWVATQWVVETSFQLPVYQNSYGNSLNKKFSANIGVRYRF
ncbi:MAG: transporter, partial [Candidatus Dadabacteria bacterium]